MRVFHFLVAGTVLAIIAGFVLFAIQYGQSPPAPDSRLSLSDLSSTSHSTPFQPDTTRLRFAVAAVVSPRTTLKYYELLASYLSIRLGRPVEIVQGKSYAEINALVRSGQAAFALVCSGAYVVGREDFGMEALVVPMVAGRITYRSYLIVPADSGTVTGWRDLQHRTFAFTDPLSNSGYLVPVYVLSQMGETPETYFRNAIFTYAHDKSIQAVADGLVDAASVDSLVYDSMKRQDPDLVSRTRVVWESPDYGANPVVVHPGIDPALRQTLREVLTGMAADTTGREVLSQLGIDAFVQPDATAYDEVERMLRVTARR